MTGSSDTVLVSVLLVCYNSTKWLPKCLESLKAQTIFAQMEVIILDNASSDGSDHLAEQLIAGWDNGKFIQVGANLGFCSANRGAEMARGKYLYFFNPDAWLEPDCLEQFYLTAERERAGGASGLMLEYEDNTLQAKGSHGFDFCGNPVSPRGGRDPQPLFCFAGFYFIRKDVYLKVGMMDERFFLYNEEMDLSWRIWISGEIMVPALTARAHHRGAAAVNPEGGTRIVENRTSAMKRFLANRNSLLVIAKNCQHVLLLMLIPCTTMILLEGFATLVMTRSPALVKQTCWNPLASFVKLLGHVRQQRRHIEQFRRLGDFQMLRFFRFGFGRSHEIKAMLQRGFPRISRG